MKRERERERGRKQVETSIKNSRDFEVPSQLERIAIAANSTQLLYVFCIQHPASNVRARILPKLLKCNRSLIITKSNASSSNYMHRSSASIYF